MSKFNDDVRDILEEVQKFLACTLASETLSMPSSTHKDVLLSKLQQFHQTYPLISSAPLSTSPSSASPPPYLEMKGQLPPQFPVLESSLSNLEEEVYEEYGCDIGIMVMTPDKTANMPDNKSLAESEGVPADEAAQNIPDVGATELLNAEKTGYLEKKGRERRLAVLLNPFQRRWCAIRNSILYYFANQNDRKQRGHIDLGGYEARPAPTATKDANKKNFCFEIVCPGKPSYQFIALTVKDMKQWIAVIERQNQDQVPRVHNGRITDSVPVTPEIKLPERISITVPKPIARPVANVPREAEDDTDEELYECVAEHKSAEEEELYEEWGSSSAPKAEEVYVDGESWGAPEPEEVYVDADAEDAFKPEDWYIGLWDCNGSGELELDFKRGELIQIIDKSYDKDAWWTGKLGSRVGLVPKAYLMDAYEQI